MKIIHTIKELREAIKAIKQQNKQVGFVPTMGALHSGHASLIKRSATENDLTAISIFVNPIQFGPTEDFDKYPRTLDADARLAEAAGADLVFAPSVDELLGRNLYTYVNIEKLQDNLCGIKRPGHFRGVCTIVSKLFNIVTPDHAYFGKKDIQQLYILKKMVANLNFDLCIVPCDIVREADGLAMSSRNRYLSAEERQDALILSRALKSAAKMIDEGERSSQKVINMIEGMIKPVQSAKIDYISVVNELMEDTEYAEKGCIIALAVFIGATRLIDNHIIGEPICF